jgi:hypothetical protein
VATLILTPILAARRLGAASFIGAAGAALARWTARR